LAGQQNNPFSFLMILGLLSFAPADTINKGLESLSLALDSTAKSLTSVKMGMDTLDNGLQQFAQHNLGHTKTSDYSEPVSNDHNHSASVMPADTQKNQNDNGNGGG